MPFSHVASDYNADQLAKLTDAFNKAWPQVLLAKGASTPAQLEWLSVSWERQTQPNRVKLVWQESGGPEVSAPKHQGFGSYLIKRAFGGQLGSARLEYDPQGVSCTLEVGLSVTLRRTIFFAVFRLCFEALTCVELSTSDQVLWKGADFGVCEHALKFFPDNL